MYSSVFICDLISKLLYIYKSFGDSYLISKIKRKKRRKKRKSEFCILIWTEYSLNFLKWKTDAGGSSTITVIKHIEWMYRMTIKHKI